MSKAFKVFREPDSWEQDTLRPPFFVVSDTHWYHKNIVKYCDRPENHDRVMVQRWNDVVSDDDVVLHLGDLFMSRRDNYDRFREKIAPRLNGRKYLILGNHDDVKLDYKGLGFEPIKPFRMGWQLPYLVSIHGADATRRASWTATSETLVVEFHHYPSAHVEPGHLRIHGHIHNNGYGTEPGVRVAARERNLNVSVEVIDYTPQPIGFLLRETLS